MDVMIIEGELKGCGSGHKNRKNLDKGVEVPAIEPEVVLEYQHRLDQ